MSESEENKTENKTGEPNAYQMAEEGWAQLNEAAEKIQKAADLLKKTPRPIDGYNIERALNKHKPDLMREHLRGLKDHRREFNV